MVTEKSDRLAELLLFYRDMYREKVVVATGWGYSGMVLLDHARKVWPKVTVVSVDTGFLFPGTLDFAESVTRHWKLDVRWNRPADSLHEPPTQECCLDRKVAPMGTLLAPYQAWISALRWDQVSTRKDTQEVETDRWGRIRLAPMLAWTSAECWDYLETNNVPVQPLHALGYRSIGCQPCTSLPAGDERSGRWNGARTECGIHEKG